MKRMSIGALVVALATAGVLWMQHPPHPTTLHAEAASANSPAPGGLPTGPRWYFGTTTTSTTSTTVPPTTVPPPPPPPTTAPRRTVARVPAQTTVHPSSPAPTGSCMSGWDGLSQSVKTAKAHACWDGLLGQYAWSTSKAFSVMMCESGGDPHNVGPPTRYGTAKGLMQVLPDGSFDPATNMAQAWKKYVGAGHSWSPWTCA